MVYEGLSGSAGRNPGVEPVEYLWRPRGSYFYLVREIALAESSRETRKIYPRYFALSPAYPDSFLPSSPSGPFYSAHRPLSRVFAHPYVRSRLALRLFSRWKSGTLLLPREGPFYLRAEDPSSLWTSPARHANARWRDEILGDGGIPDFNKGDSSPLCDSFVYHPTYIWMLKIRLISAFDDPYGKPHWDHSVNRKCENVMSW